MPGPRRQAALGVSSGVWATAAVWRARHAASAVAIDSSFSARIAAASRAALIAPARPIASVPTGTPPGIWTIESRLSSPLSARLSIGTPSTGSDRQRRDHAGQMRRTAGTRDDHLEAPRLRLARIAHQPLRRAMGGHDPLLERHAQRLERGRGVA